MSAITRIGDPIRAGSEEDYILDLFDRQEETGADVEMDVPANYVSAVLEIDIDRKDGNGWVALPDKVLLIFGNPINRVGCTWGPTDIDLQGSRRGKLRITVALTNAVGQTVRSPTPIYEEVAP